MKTKNAVKVSGGNNRKSSEHSAPYPDGSIGANLAKRNYVKYLIERYNRYREADERFGPADRFYYSLLFKNIESKFKAPTYFIPERRFGELVDFLQHRVDTTILGRVKAKRGMPNYESFDEYLMRQT